MKEKMMVLSDIDGTLLRSSLVLESAVEMHESGRINLGRLPKQWRADAKNEALVKELAVAYQYALVGHGLDYVNPLATVARILADESKHYNTLKTLVSYRRAGHDVVLISGSPNYLVDPFADYFGFRAYSSDYELKENAFTGNINLMANSEAKQAVIDGLDLESYSKVIGFGDTASDAPIFAASHHSILVEPTIHTVAELKASNVRVDEVLHYN